MAESRKKTHHILLNVDGKSISLELFDAREWPNLSSDDGEYRVRINGKWYSPAGKYTFLRYEAVGRLVAGLLAGETLLEDEAPPALQPRQRVHVHYGECIEGMALNVASGWVVTPPFRDVSGRWYVHVSLNGATAAYPCHDVEPLRRAARDV